MSDARTMQQLFEAVHHGRLSFDEFLDLDTAANVDRVGWSGRTIFKPSTKLKQILSFLNRFVFAYSPINDRVSFAYRKRANPHNALLPHASNRALFQTDLTKFFERIDGAMINAVVEATPAPVTDLESHRERVVSLVTVENQLAIGFPTSPIISNACLKPFDDVFEVVCAKKGLTYTRYADDIFVSGNDRDELVAMEGVVAETLASTLGPRFVINESKTKLMTRGRKIAALGLTILPSGQVTIDRSTREKIEYQLHFLRTDRAKLANIYEGDLSKGLQSLAGYISHVNAADPKYLSKLRRKYGSTVIDGLLHRSIA